MKTAVFMLLDALCVIGVVLGLVFIAVMFALLFQGPLTFGEILLEDREFSWWHLLQLAPYYVLLMYWWDSAYERSRGG